MTQKSTTQKKRSEASTCKPKPSIQKGKTKKPEKDKTKKSKSLVPENNRKQPASPGKKERSVRQQAPKPINFEDFETFEPKQTFLEGYTPLRKVADERGCTIWKARRDTNRQIFFVK